MCLLGPKQIGNIVNIAASTPNLSHSVVTRKIMNEGNANVNSQLPGMTKPKLYFILLCCLGPFLNFHFA